MNDYLRVPWASHQSDWSHFGRKLGQRNLTKTQSESFHTDCYRCLSKVWFKNSITECNQHDTEDATQHTVIHTYSAIWIGQLVWRTIKCFQVKRFLLVKGDDLGERCCMVFIVHLTFPEDGKTTVRKQVVVAIACCCYSDFQHITMHLLG